MWEIKLYILYSTYIPVNIKMQSLVQLRFNYRYLTVVLMWFKFSRGNVGVLHCIKNIGHFGHKEIKNMYEEVQILF